MSAAANETAKDKHHDSPVGDRSDEVEKIIASKGLSIHSEGLNGDVDVSQLDIFYSTLGKRLNYLVTGMLDNTVKLIFSCLRPNVTVPVIETYISAKVDDDLEIVKVKMLSNGTASAIVKGMTDVNGFVNQRHKISGGFSEVSLADLDSESNDSSDPTTAQCDIIPDLIEVTCDGSIDKEILDMYFSGKKSGGRREKEIESVDEINNGVYHVKFETKEDAAAVITQASHVCSKKQLTVRYVPAPVPKEYDKNKLIVRNIPDSVCEDFFSTHIESRLGLDSDEDFTVDFRKNCAIIVFTENYTDEELDEMMKKLTKKKIRNQLLSIERCEVNRSIVVKNITKNAFANEDSLEMYFERKQSGGGEEMVEKVVMLGKDSAKVTFAIPSVVDCVLRSNISHKNKLGSGVILSVCTPLDSFEVSQNDSSSEETAETSSDEEPEMKVPPTKTLSTVAKRKESQDKLKKPKSFKSKGKVNKDEEDLEDSKGTAVIVHAPIVLHLDSMIAKYLDHTPTLIAELSNEFQVNISIDEKAGTIVLSQSEVSPLDWPSTTEKIQLILSDLVCKTAINVPSEGAGEIYPIIIGSCIQENLQYELGQGDNKVYVAGRTQLVNKLKNDVEELCGRLVHKVEVINVNEEDYVYLKATTLSSLQSEYQSIQIQCVDIEHSLSVNGCLRDITAFKQNFLKYTSHSRVTVSLHPLASDFLCNGKGSGILQSLLQGTRCVPYFVPGASGSQQFSLILLCPQEKAYEAENVAMKVCDGVKVQTMSLPKHFISSAGKWQKFSSYKDDLVKKIPHLSVIQDEELVIASSSEASSSLYQALKTFIGEECSIVESIRFKKGAWRLLQTTSVGKRWTDITEELKKLDVAIVSSSKSSVQKPFVKIKGMPESIAIAKQKLLDLQRSIIEQNLPIARPGVCQYFFNDPNGQMIVKGIETQANVCIEMGVKEDEQTSINTSANKEFTRVCFGNTNEMKSINVYVGDITEFNRAEVIVNAANENLKHAGGVAQAIETKGGSQIRQDSENHVRSRGRLITGSAVLFPRVGNLLPPYKAIVHAVGPRWEQQNDKEKACALLKKAVCSSLTEAKDYNSIAIPAISGGIYGFPPDVCATILMEAAKKFSEKERNATLNEINFVVLQDNVETFISAAKKCFSNIQCLSDAMSHPATTNTPTNSLASQGRRRRRATSTTPANPVSNSPIVPLSSSAADVAIPTTVSAKTTNHPSSVMWKIKVTKGDILKNMEDIVVNITDQKFSFNGFVATALKKHAGPGLEEECKTTKTPLQMGAVVTTGAHNLDAKYILHIVLPNYNSPNSIQVLSDLIIKCLDECNRLGLKSISIPSVGAGNLQYPPDVVAKCLLETSADYIAKHQHKMSLQLVHFVIFDKGIHQEFLKHYAILEGPAGPSRSASYGIPQSSFGHQQQHYPQQDISMNGNPSSFSFFFSNNLHLEVVKNDIADSQVDVIVNTTNQYLRLVGSAVSTALAKKAGPDLQYACENLVRHGTRISEGNVVETPCANMGSLRCKSIFHIVFSKDKLEQAIFACLEKAEKMKYSSIAFPPIGTGGGNISPQFAADAVVSALKKFTSKRAPKYLSVIQMVLFQSQHYHQFVDAFKKMESTNGGFFRKMINAVGSYFFYGDEEAESWDETENMFDDRELDDDIEPNIFANLSRQAEVIISIYGESEQSVGRAEKKLRAVIDTQFVTDEIEDSNIRFLTDLQVSKLQEFSKSHQVDIDIEREFDLNSITIHGCQKDVLMVKDKVRDALATINREQMKREAAEAMSKHIRWIRIIEDDDTEEYDEVFTYEIERAFQKNKKKKFVSSDDSEQFEINFKSMEEKDLVTGDVLKVKRLDFLKEERPSEWEPMPTNSAGKEEIAHLVTLAPDSEEYLEVEKKFNLTMQKGSTYSKIHSIQRLQNPLLYGQYIARKKEMDRRNPIGHENEKWLFHGTHSNVLDNINTQGFNRIFKGRNGTVYGEGVYFARDAQYSDGYAVPDAKGLKSMYLTRVLTGEYTVGTQGMKLPPPKDPNANKHVLFDSTVNNQASPSIFVVYYDSLNYPAYLIKYS